MKNKLLIIFTLLLILPLTVSAEEKPNVVNLSTHTEDGGNIIIFGGTTENSAHAVMCKLLNGNEEIDKLSVEVTNEGTNGTFGGSFIAPSTGNYTVSCANYEGGTIVTDDVAVEEMTQFTVEFNTNGGSEIAPINVNAGEVIERPADPTKDGKVFAGWYQDITLTVPFDFSTRITAFITIYAKWNDAPETAPTIQLQTIFYGEGGTYQVDFAADDSINPDPLGEPVNSSHRYFVSEGEEVILTAYPSEGYHFVGWYNTHEENNHYVLDDLVSNQTTYNFTPEGEYVNLQVVFAEDNNNPETFTVEFNTNGGSEIAPIEVESGQKVTRPEDPTNGNKIFAGWYQDNTLTTEFNFNTPITANTTIYAKWNEPIVYHTVEFNTNGGSAIAAVEVKDGDPVAKPDNPTKDGKIFDNWYEDEELEHKYDFNNPVTGGLSLYAKWVQEYTKNDGNGNEVTFTSEENQNLHLVIKDYEDLTDAELEILGMNRETFNALVDSLTESAKKYGTVISFLDITVYNQNNDPIEINNQVNINLMYTDEMGDYKYYKLVYISGDDNGNPVLDNKSYKLTKQGDKLVGTLPHLSSYVLVGSNTEETTNTETTSNTTTSATTASSPKTSDNILIWFIILGVSLTGLLILKVSNKKLKKSR